MGISSGTIATLRPLGPMIETSQAPLPMLDPAPLVRDEGRWMRFVGLAISGLILCAAFYQLHGLNIRSLAGLLPTRPAFWAVFMITYLAPPALEWVIFRRLWDLPAGGFMALLRKLVSNEILLGYLGEVYFYAWARRHANVVAAPFGAIKDVTILSALTGNVATLALFLVAAPILWSLHLGLSSHMLVLSGLFVLVTSFAMLLLRKSLFTLPRQDLWFIAAVHMLRIVITGVLAAVMWHMLLPSVALSWWLVLSALRMLLSRLPFLPNKDIVFAGLAAFLVGSGTQIVAAMAVMAMLILAAHICVGALVGLGGIVGKDAQ